jgi:hypothetical protein
MEAVIVIRHLSSDVKSDHGSPITDYGGRRTTRDARRMTDDG